MRQVHVTDNFDQWRRKINENFADYAERMTHVGDPALLNTQNNETMVLAINELMDVLNDIVVTMDGGSASNG